jgi:hypothetical protein
MRSTSPCSQHGRFALLRTLLPGGAEEIAVDVYGEVTDFVATARNASSTGVS